MAQQQHPQLKKSLVAEALLEVRYAASDLSYGLVPGRLYEALKDFFPTSVELPITKVPVEIAPEFLARHRFTSTDGSRMYQVGAGVISVNHLRYAGYTAFLNDCRKVLTAASDIGLMRRLKRRGLRYINAADLDRPWSDMIQIRIQAPESLTSNDKGQEHRWLNEFPGVGMLSTTVAWPTDVSGRQGLAIDLDCFSGIDREITVDEIIEWIDAAHENIYRAFLSCLVPGYYAELKGE